MKLPKSYYNNLSLAGTVISGIALLLIIFTFIISMFFEAGSNYLGLFSYILLPAIMIIGLLLIPLGMMLALRRAKKGNVDLKGHWMVIDFNDPRYRNAASVFIIGTVVLGLLSSVGSYEAYHYTESVEFCGTMCHKVMEPEYTTYLHSSHARVKCVDCHVGQGANWYVKSKLSGLYQVYAVLSDKYPKPIPTPITNLRPARETCEQCHWPQKFYNNSIQVEKHFLTDSANTQWDIHLQMKTGGSHSANNLQEGIHWHINPNIKIEYIATASDLETIPWVRYINLQTGDTVVYQDTWMPLEPENIKNDAIHTMDCMDCHNRPSHNYKVPQYFIDEALAAGHIPLLPEIKYQAMELLKDPYPSTDTAYLVISQHLRDFYTNNYPNVDTKDVEKAIAGIKAGYSRNIFSGMGASWDVYPDHIGHIVYNGCFRCHNDTHENSLGEKITKDCDACHSILLQGPPGLIETAPINGSLPFKHPVDIGDAWQESLCTDCHRYLFL